MNRNKLTLMVLAGSAALAFIALPAASAAPLTVTVMPSMPEQGIVTPEYNWYTAENVVNATKKAADAVAAATFVVKVVQVTSRATPYTADIAATITSSSSSSSGGAALKAKRDALAGFDR